MAKISLKEYRRYTRHLLRDFDIEITEEIRAQLRICKTRIEMERFRDKLINERLEKEFENG